MHVSGQLARIRVNLWNILALMQTSTGYIAQWLERLTADQQVPGSNPGVPFFSVVFAVPAPAGAIASCWQTSARPGRPG